MRFQGSLTKISKKNTYNFLKNWKSLVFLLFNGVRLFYFYNEVYYIIFSSKSNFSINLQTNSIFFKKYSFYDNLFGVKKYNLIGTYILKFLNNFLYLYFIKLNYSGKGYRLYSRRKFYIYPKLNYSHKLYLYSFNTITLVTSRWSLMFFSKSYSSIRNFIISIINLRPINIFTKKGIRLRKQIIYSKVGKVSSY